MMRKTTIAKRLDTAADIIQERGLNCCWMGEPGCARCAHGAIAEACRYNFGDDFFDNPNWNGSKARLDHDQVLSAAVHGLGFDDKAELWRWSDQSKSKVRVVKGLRRVAAELRDTK